jgi:hypothetical protein
MPALPQPGDFEPRGWMETTTDQDFRWE